MKLLRNSLISLNLWDKLFLLIALAIFLNPLIIFLLSNFGFSIIYHQVNVYFVFLLLILSILYIFDSDRISFFHTILSTFISIFFLTIIGSFYAVFDKVGLSQLIGLYATTAGAPLISVFFLKHYKRNGNIDVFIKFLFFTGVIIALVNIYFFFLLYFGDYTKVYGYTEFIGLGSYLKDLGTFFIRPAGFFFDYHSQYYIPMFCIIFIVSKDLKIKSLMLKIIVLLVCIVSILISGIKSAYLTGVVLLFFYFIKQLSFLKILLSIFLLFLLATSIDYYYDSVIYDLVYKIFTHDINILLEHIFDVPKLLLSNYFHVFLFGGQVGMEGYVYSEVYLVTLIYYVGIIGLIMLFIYPIIFTFVKGKTFLIQSITIVFAMSLIHYYVFKSSFNIIATSLFYFFFFCELYKNQLNNE